MPVAMAGLRYDRLSVLRRTSILVTASLVAAFVQAPTLHVHQHEETQKHNGSLFHTHVKHAVADPSHGTHMLGWDPDQDARFTDWFSATKQDRAFFPVIVPALLAGLDSLEISGWTPPAANPVAHDPPEVEACAPRGPPLS